ncbi:hypothetical protein VPJG_00036 [Vibrio phage jenny 12G5]|nr:hypothetical protein VPJG_00036 [Vibrio phage jenny 12G5]
MSAQHQQARQRNNKHKHHSQWTYPEHTRHVRQDEWQNLMLEVIRRKIIAM